MIGAANLIVAAAADVLWGDPPAWPHLVRYMGRACSASEAWLRPWASNAAKLRLAGGLMALLVVGGFGLGSWALLQLVLDLWGPLGWLLGLLLSFQCLAAGQLWREAEAVARPLWENDLQLARRRLSMIVGRDTGALDATGVRRALIETIAESLNDGVVAPLFYLALGGPAAAVAYKAVNTLDSMVGYRNQAYGDLGLVPARLDDLAGWIPARLTALLVVPAAALLGLSPAEAWRALGQDRRAHSSPNAGWPEAAAAGALQVRLGGPNYYGGVLHDKPWLNPQGRQPAAGDVAGAQRLLVMVSLLATLLAALGAALLRGWL